MRTLPVFVVAAGLILGAASLVCTSAMAQPGDAAKKDEPKKDEKPAAPASPTAIPVPNLPILSTKDIGDGLIVEEMKIGDGYEVKPGGAVVANYHGTLKSDGTMFDSSFERGGEPIPFSLGQVIEGWQKGVPGMKIGGIRKLTVPAKMAYDQNPPTAKIPKGADLVFIIQLVDALQVTDTKVGEGEMIAKPSVLVTAFSMKDGEGHEVAKESRERPYIWIPQESMAIEYGTEGMRVGGKRMIKCPKEFNQGNPMLSNNRPLNVACTFEIELVALRNLPQGRGQR